MRQSRVGIDLVEISRFKGLGRHSVFLRRVFHTQEINYCFERSDPTTHFAGMFAAKEAASKALGVEQYPFIELEIRHAKNGAPEVWYKKRRLLVHISITHTKTMAAAVALT